MLTKERKGEIAMLLLRDRIKKEGIKLIPNELKREAGNLTERTGVPVRELMELFEELTMELVNETFKK
jgi:uncharacterized protein YfbU (UPF0304 family)